MRPLGADIECIEAKFGELLPGAFFFATLDSWEKCYIALGSRSQTAVDLNHGCQHRRFGLDSIVYVPVDNRDIPSLSALAYKQGMHASLIAVAAMFPEISGDKLNELSDMLFDAYDDDPEIRKAKYQRILQSLLPIGPGDIVEVTNKNKANDSYKILVTELNHNALYGINLDSTKAYAGLLMRGNTELLHNDDSYMYKRIGHEESYMNLLKSLSNTYQSNKEEE